MEEVLLVMVIKSMDIHDLLQLASATTIFASFDLWMSRGGIEHLLSLSIISLKIGSLCMLLLACLR
jgi:hypothetical protein